MHPHGMAERVRVSTHILCTCSFLKSMPDQCAKSMCCDRLSFAPCCLPLISYAKRRSLFLSPVQNPNSALALQGFDVRVFLQFKNCQEQNNFCISCIYLFTEFKMRVENFYSRRICEPVFHQQSCDIIAQHQPLEKSRRYSSDNEYEKGK